MLDRSLGEAMQQAITQRSSSARGWIHPLSAPAEKRRFIGVRFPGMIRGRRVYAPTMRSHIASGGGRRFILTRVQMTCQRAIPRAGQLTRAGR